MIVAKKANGTQIKLSGNNGKNGKFIDLWFGNFQLDDFFWNNWFPRNEYWTTLTIEYERDNEFWLATFDVGFVFEFIRLEIFHSSNFYNNWKFKFIL
jgi:hypothetical protein